LDAVEGAGECAGLELVNDEMHVVVVVVVRPRFDRESSRERENVAMTSLIVIIPPNLK
jgi:hypothetical protein